MSLFVFGLGYSAMHYVATRAAGERIGATVRSGEKARQIAAMQPNVQVLIVGETAADPRTKDWLLSSTRLLISIPPSDSGDPVLAHFRDMIAAAPNLERIVYLSTIGVYGDHAGGWVDENAQTEPSSARNRARVVAEREWLALAERTGKTVTILRLAGIYGPDRSAIVNLRAGTARRLVKPGQVFNRIHVEDIARAIEGAFAPAAPAGIFNVTDDEPAPPQDVIAYAARVLGVEPPPEIPFESADLTPMARSFYAANKRVSNRRMKEKLGIALAYPTYRHGLNALAAEFVDEPHKKIVGAGPSIS